MDWGARVIVFTDTSPLFKGLALIILGLLAFWFSRKYKSSAEESLGRKVFTLLSIFIILYGLFILIFRPAWWNPPY